MAANISIRALALWAGLAAFASACDDGILQVEYGDGHVAVPGAVDPAEAPGSSEGDVIDPVTGLPQQPGGVDEPQLPSVLQHATFGERCVGGATVRYLVLSDEPSDCANDATRIDTATTSGELVGAVAIELDGADQVAQSVRYCAAPGDCRDLALSFTLDDRGEAVTGAWTGAPTGVEQTVAFDAARCAFDQAVEPLPADTPAVGISVSEVAVYQGVKIPIVQNGAVVSERNAPIIAGRPGVVRVFVEPQTDWQARDLVVRLTIDDVVKEQTFLPAGPSAETDGESTINFELTDGELQSDSSYSVELLEAASCADVSGALAVSRVPEVDAAPLQAQALPKKLRVTLVPIQYNADGSGRLPDLSAGTVERFRSELFTHYPVHDVEITVREAVATSGGLSPNGSGFGAMLNLCLNLRANDNVEPDVYYYCVIQPANSKTAFCGSGCVGGVAPLAGASDVNSRGGIGISFGGDGEGVFVHELGHALGRPHSPCGGASGTDPNYPHAQGLIGSWGYNILSGQLFPPSQLADFMGYCNPAWVSDYTYERLFNRLSFVLGAQALRVQTVPTRWRTAVIEADGSASWGGDVTLSHLPDGLAVQANLRSATGVPVATPTVYVTPIADVDAFLLTVEDTGAATGTIEVPGVGDIEL